MAQPTNTYDSYDQTGIREDLSDVIHDISPTETPFYSGAAKTSASNTYHEWQTDALRSSAANAHIGSLFRIPQAHTFAVASALPSNLTTTVKIPSL